MLTILSVWHIRRLGTIAFLYQKTPQQRIIVRILDKRLALSIQNSKANRLGVRRNRAILYGFIMGSWWAHTKPMVSGQLVPRYDSRQPNGIG